MSCESMQELEAQWIGQALSALEQFTVVFAQLGAAHEPLRTTLSTVGDKSVDLASDRDVSLFPIEKQQRIVLTGLEQFVDSPHKLGDLREQTLRAVTTTNARVLLVSRVPRICYAETPGSSILEDAKFIAPPLVEAETDGAPETRLPAMASKDFDHFQDLLRTIFVELGSAVCASLDHAIFEAGLGETECLEALPPREFESLCGSGLTIKTGGARLWSVEKRFTEVKSVLSDVVSTSVVPQYAYDRIYGYLFSLERQIRNAVRVRAIEEWPSKWRTQVLNGDLGDKVLERAGEDAYRTARSVAELRDPLEWLTLGELLQIRGREEIGLLGLDKRLWDRLADDVVPVRNRLTHMRLVRPEDLSQVRRWAQVITQALTPK